MTALELQPERASRLRPIVAATTMAATLAINSFVVCEAEAVTEAPSAVADISAEAQYTANAAKCVPTDLTSLHKVKKLLNHPHNFEANIHNIPHQHTTASELMAKRQEAARKFNLTVFNYPRKYRTLFSDVKHGNDIPVSTYLQKANEFAAHYGVTVTAPNPMPDTHSAEQITPIDMGSLSAAEQMNARYTLTRIIDNLGELPIELVKSVGLRHIYLGRIASAPVTGYADMISGDSMYLDPSKHKDVRDTSHEFTHLWDAKECYGPSGAFQDPEFDALNPANVYDQYPYNPNRQTDRGAYTDRNTVAKSSPAQKLARKIQHDYASNNYARAGRHWRMYDALFKNVVAMTPYSLKNAAEDKATIGEEIFTPYNYQGVYDIGDPILSSKFARLMARIYQAHPRFAKYLIRVGNNTF